MKVPTIVVAASAVLATATPLQAQAGKRIPDGTYECMIWMGSSYVSMGKITSRNNSLDTNLLKKVGATFKSATPTAKGVTVNYLTKRGYNESMDCTRK